MTLRHSARPFIKVVDDLGLQIVDASITGTGHYKITVTFEGNTYFFIAPRSASDYRALANFRSVVKRWKKSLQHQEIS